MKTKNFNTLNRAFGSQTYLLETEFKYKYFQFAVLEK